MSGERLSLPLSLSLLVDHTLDQMVSLTLLEILSDAESDGGCLV